MKITVEIKDEDVERLKQYFGIDTEVLINALATAMIEAMKEFSVVNHAKVPLSLEALKKFGNEVGRRVWNEAKRKE